VRRGWSRAARRSATAAACRRIRGAEARFVGVAPEATGCRCVVLAARVVVLAGDARIAVVVARAALVAVVGESLAATGVSGAAGANGSSSS